MAAPRFLLIAAFLAASGARAGVLTRADATICRDGLEPALELAAPGGLRRLVPLRQLEAQIHEMHSRLLLDPSLAPSLSLARLRLRFDDKASAPLAAFWDGTVVLSLDAARLIAAEANTALIAPSLDAIPRTLWLPLAQALVRLKCLEEMSQPQAWRILQKEEQALHSWATAQGFSLPTAEERARDRLVPALAALAQSADWLGILSAVAPGHEAAFDAALAAALTTDDDKRPRVLGQWLLDVILLTTFPHSEVSTADQFFEGFLKASYLAAQPGVLAQQAPHYAHRLFALWQSSIAGSSLP